MGGTIAGWRQVAVDNLSDSQTKHVEVCLFVPVASHNGGLLLDLEQALAECSLSICLDKETS